MLDMPVAALVISRPTANRLPFVMKAHAARALAPVIHSCAGLSDREVGVGPASGMMKSEHDMLLGDSRAHEVRGNLIHRLRFWA